METQTLLNKSESFLSFRFGKTGDEVKIYFETIKELDKKLRELFPVVDKVINYKRGVQE